MCLMMVSLNIRKVCGGSVAMYIFKVVSSTGSGFSMYKAGASAVYCSAVWYNEHFTKKGGWVCASFYEILFLLFLLNANSTGLHFACPLVMDYNHSC